MAKRDKLLEKARQAPNGLRFDELCKLAELYGFQFQRQRGSHHIYKHPEYPYILTFPECAGNVKAGYVKLLLDAIDEVGGPDEQIQFPNPVE
jgi:predicted RNA binding protein YcfA (HicA-like mRNA interferase family)